MMGDPFFVQQQIRAGLTNLLHEWPKWQVKLKIRGPEGKQKYSSTLPSTSALDGVGGQRNAPAALPPGKTRYPFYRRLDRP